MTMSFRINKPILKLLITGFGSIFVFVSCDELESVNPVDPAYTLEPPTLTQASAKSDTEVELRWLDNEEHTLKFVIFRKMNNSIYAEIAALSKDILTYTDSNCVLGISYSYGITSKYDSNLSELSNERKTATIFPPPTNIAVTALSDVSIQISWRDNCSFEQGFRIERSNDSVFIEIGTVSANVTEYTDTGLALGQTYEYRVAAYTVSNTSDYTATASATAPLVDWDGNTYGTVRIGNQVWMAENLKVTHYRDGTPITPVTDPGEWTALTTEAYCIYNNNTSNELDTYGALYNWYAVTNGHNIAPEGWHVPTDDEWTTLTNHLGGAGVAGEKLKETGTNHWNSPNTGATNESGFTALPGGYRTNNGNYYVLGTYGYFWSATESSSSTAWYRILNYGDSDVGRVSQLKRFGFSVRCVRD